MGKRVALQNIDIDLSIVETPQERYARESDELFYEGTPWSEEGDD